MKLFRLIWVFLLLCSAAAFATNTTVTLQVTDTDGQSWNNSTWNVSLIPLPGSNAQPPYFGVTGGTGLSFNQSGVLNGTGGATLSLTPNSIITPANTIWQFQICPNASASCFQQTVIIVGATQTVTLTPPPIRLTGYFPPGQTLAYSDNEVQAPTLGASYYNVTTLTQRQWNGTIWTNTGGVSGLADPGSNGVIKRTALNVTAPATSSDVVNLFSSCSGTQYLGADGTCHNSAASAFPITTAVQAQNGGSLSPSGIGQNVANQFWMAPAIPVFTGTMNLTGGSLSAIPYFIKVVYNNASGSSLSSIEESPGSTYNGSIPIVQNCGVGPSCSITMNAITLPSGYTSWSAYMASTSGAEQLVTACTNIASGAGCTITAVGTGATVPTTISAYLQPPNVQASECPLSVIPSMFLPDNSGNYRTVGGVDPNSGNGQTSGTWTICHRTWFNDTLTTPPQGNNAFVLIDHAAGTGTSTTNQDRSLWVGLSTPAGDASTRYALEAIQSELDFNCNGCSINGSPDGEVSDASFNTTENSATNYTTPNGFGTNVIRATLFKAGSGATGQYNVLNGGFSFSSNANTLPGGTTGATVRSKCSSTNSQTGLWCFGLFHTYNTVATGWQAALWVPTQTAPGGSNNYFIGNDIVGLPTFLNGPVTLSAIKTNAIATLPITASPTITGGLATVQPTISGPTGVTCTGGASTYAYKFVGVDVNGGAVTSGQGLCVTGVNPLTSGNPATVTLSFTSSTGTPFVRIDVYRVSGPMTTGKIGSLSCTTSSGLDGVNLCSAFSDTGLAADSGTAPSVNTTGTESVAGYANLAGNKAFVTTNFTTAANTSFQTITGLSFPLLPVAGNYQGTCHGAYSQATGLASVSFGIQAATVNPTNIFATGKQQIAAATAPAPQILATLATTTPTAITTGTPAVNGTNYTFDLDFSIENPANDAGNVLNIMVSTAVAGDAVTVLRDSYCYLY